MGDDAKMLEFRRAYRESTGGATTYVHRLKCLRCRLEFGVFSWSAEWPHICDWPSGARNRSLQERSRPTCPGCGQDTDFLHGRAVNEDPIFTLSTAEPTWMWVKGRYRAVTTRQSG